MLSQLAKLWKCSIDRAEDALRNDESHARCVLSRRQLFGVAAALACPLSEPTKAFGFIQHYTTITYWVDAPVGWGHRAITYRIPNSDYMRVTRAFNDYWLEMMRCREEQRTPTLIIPFQQYRIPLPLPERYKHDSP